MQLVALTTSLSAKDLQLRPWPSNPCRKIKLFFFVESFSSSIEVILNPFNSTSFVWVLKATLSTDLAYSWEFGEAAKQSLCSCESLSLFIIINYCEAIKSLLSSAFIEVTWLKVIYACRRSSAKSRLRLLKLVDSWFLDVDLSWPVIGLRVYLRFYLLEFIHSFNHANGLSAWDKPPEDRMIWLIEIWQSIQRHDELRTDFAFRISCCCQQVRLNKLHAVFLRWHRGGVIDCSCPRSIPIHKVTGSKELSRNNLVDVSISISSVWTEVSGTESQKVVHSLGGLLAEELEVHSARIFAVDFDIKEGL